MGFGVWGFLWDFYWYFVTQVKVHHVSNATRLWVSLLEHQPLEMENQTVPSLDPFFTMKLSLDLAVYHGGSNKQHLYGTYIVDCNIILLHVLEFYLR